MKIYLNTDNTIKMITNENLNGDFIELSKEEFMEFQELLKLETNQIKLTYINNAFKFNIDYNTAIEILRNQRDRKITETDYLFLSDTSSLTTSTEKTAIKAKRKQLRDITNDLKDGDVIEILKAIKTVNNIYNK